MTQLKQQLIEKLRKIEGVQDKPSPVSGGTALFYFDKEFAHFHNDYELDLKLTKQKISELGLTHPVDSVYHPARSANSPWIEIRFNNLSDLDHVSNLVNIAITKR